jgi:hypothetical protein
MKIHPISIDSLALFVIATGCPVESLFVDLEIRNAIFHGGDSTGRLHMIHVLITDPPIIGEPKGATGGGQVWDAVLVWA